MNELAYLLGVGLVGGVLGGIFVAVLYWMWIVYDVHVRGAE